MSVYLPKDCRTWRYRFTWRGQLYKGSTGQITEADAKLVDAAEQLRVRQSAYGIAPFDPTRSPRFADWVEIYFTDVTTRRRDRIKRPERIETLIRVVLRFWGARPTVVTKHDVGPFHDLRLIDPIADPSWLTRFELWMSTHGWQGQTKNQYRSLMSQLYKLAMAPAWTKITGIERNPFRDIERDPKVSRTATTSLEDLRKVLTHASYHIRLALAIGLLAHKLRRDNILKLTWSQHILELGPRTLPDGRIVYGWIKVGDHKTNRATGRPMVLPIPKQLHDILVDARSRSTSDYVITYRGQPVQDIRSGLKLICARAGVPYGRFTATGLTFHTLRHTSSTAMVELDIPRDKRKQASGHTSDAAQDLYEHLHPIQEIGPREQLSDAFPIADLVTARVRLVPDPQPDQGDSAPRENIRKRGTAYARRQALRIATRSSDSGG